MGTYSGTWKTVAGDRVFITINEGLLLRTVRIRDGTYEYTDNTLERTTHFKRSVEKQKHLEETLSKYVEEHNNVDDAVDRVNELYNTDW